MIPDTSHRSVERSDEPVASTQFGISRGDEAHLMTVLRDTLYSDKILAVLREYTSNAWDEHRQSGKSNVPISVTLPTPQEPTLRIRDFGRGLSRSDILGVFSLYGASTKRDSNDAIGCMGIGSKSTFCYTDSFTVVSRHTGMRSTYVCSIDTSERGSIELVDEAVATEEETGLEIIIAVKPSDCAEFETKARELLSAMSPLPHVRIDGTLLSIEPLSRGLDTNSTEWTAVMGCVPYPISLPHLRGLNPLAHKCGGVVEFAVGEVGVAASREALRYTDTTSRVLAQHINDACDAWIRKALTEWESANSDFAKRVVLAKMPLLATLAVVKPWVGDVDLTMLRKTHNILIRRNKKGRFVDHDELYLHPDTRIVIRDDKRAMVGYGLTEYDYVVKPRDAQVASVVAQLIKAHLGTQRATGCPIHLTSRLPWTKPIHKRSSSTAPQPRPVKASMYQLRDGRLSETMSANWRGIEREPTPDDVYVILDRFRPMGVDYETMSTDFSVLRAFDLPVPEVYGYKKATAADKQPVGVAYAEWRKGLAERVKAASQQARDAVAVYVLADAASWSGDYESVSKALGPSHAITRLLRDASSASVQLQAMSWHRSRLIQRLVTDADRAEPRRRVDAVFAQYPLLRHNPSKLGVLKGDGEWFDSWIAYIKQQDMLSATTLSGNTSIGRHVNNGH